MDKPQRTLPKTVFNEVLNGLLLLLALRLPGTPPIALGLGPLHRHQCLRALAMMPAEAPA